MKIGIIGSGIAGLAAAVRMAVKGHEVTVYEKNNYPGGKISELYLKDYRFDTGPSLFTLPELAEELFRLCGEDMADYLPYRRLDVNCKYFFPDGTLFNFYHDKEQLVEEIKDKTWEDPDHFIQRMQQAKEMYELSAPVFIFSSFQKLSDFNTAPYRKLGRKLFKLDFFRTMHGANRRDFRDSRIVQLFDRYATYNGSSPYRAPATLNMIAHLENNIGSFFPEKGMYAIIHSIYLLALKNEVKFCFGKKVEEIITRNGKATGLVYEGKAEDFDIVISDSDVRYVANYMIPEHPLRKRLNKLAPSSSALVFYWGIRHTYSRLELHNVLFSDNYKKEFKKIFDEKTLPDDPTIYIFISSKLVKEDAPPGCENWFVMVNAPADDGQDWEELISRARKNIIAKINKTLNTAIENYIEAEQIANPQTIEEQTLSVDGALYGPASNSPMSAFLRHPNYLKQINDLYFVGGSAHPGGGIPLCLASAEIVEKEITLKYGGK
ncbi:MAG: phytoene desaturase [Candidatus Azobacteroides sp.]|nr:phytoene desaturase [Candidatus Azobacteroides sp.]